MARLSTFACPCRREGRGRRLPRAAERPSIMRLVVGLVLVLLWLAPASSAAGGGFAVGDLFVADHSQVVEYTADGAVVRTIIDPSFVQVFDLAFSPSAQALYVTDAIAHDVKVLDGSGNVISSFGAQFLAQPRGIAVASNGDVYVADTGGDDVDVFDANGNHLRSIGPVPVPLNLALSADGRRLFVSESNYFAGVQVFDLADADRYLGTFGETSAQVGLTNGLAVASDGTLYVGDGIFGNGTDTVKVFNVDGSFAGTLISGLTAPIDLTLGGGGNIWLTNTNDFVGDQIRAYALSGAFLKSFGADLVQPTGLAFVVGAGAPASVQFLQPLDQSADPANPFLNTGKNGRVIPVKVTITNGTMPVTGSDTPTPFVTINVSTLESCSSTAGSDPVESFADAGSSSAGTNQLRWNALAGEWDYNLDTKALGLITGNCYRIDISLNGSQISNAFAVYQPTK
jgi:DNA-binding beta-propeller fold protein YncE